MENPFKYGTIVESPYFTDRKEELKELIHKLDSQNHIVLISPRRYGKSSLVHKTVSEIGRPSIRINLQMIDSEQELAAKLIKEIMRLNPWEKVKEFLRHFSVVPTVSINPLTDSTDISFSIGSDKATILEDAFGLMDRISLPGKRLIVVLDEFQEILRIGDGLDRRLRSIMQEQKNVNYILLGSQESMMTDIFEKKKSPFYHFGFLMRLKRIPYDDFYSFLRDRLEGVSETATDDIIRQILSFSACHPYYTQLVASEVWESFVYKNITESNFEYAITGLIHSHDLDYERLWSTFSRSDREILKNLSLNKGFSTNVRTSTAYSALNKLVKKGYVIKNGGFEIEDPLFGRWIRDNVG